jgi:hypothetical protein
MGEYCIEMALYFDEQGKLRRRMARDREVVRLPLDRGSRGRFALVQQRRRNTPVMLPPGRAMLGTRPC